MPVRRDREYCFVLTKCRPDGPAQLPYGFMSGVDAGDRATLGHQLVSGGATVNMPIVFGANRPKPPRMSKVKETGTESGFVAADNIDTAKAAEWRITTAAKFALPKTSKKQVAVFVETTGLSNPGGPTLKYAWMMDKGDVAAFGQVLGIRTVQGNDDVAFGVNRPKPANVVTVISGRTTGSFAEDTKIDTVVSGGTWSVRKNAIPPR